MRKMLLTLFCVISMTVLGLTGCSTSSDQNTTTTPEITIEQPAQTDNTVVDPGTSTPDPNVSMPSSN